MKIVIGAGQNENVAGVAGSLASIGEQVIIWDKARKPAIDMFDEIHPDVLIVESKDVDKALLIGLDDNRQTKVALFGMFAPAGVNPTVMCFPSELSKVQVDMLTKAQKTPWLQMQPAANVAQFYNGKYTPDYDTDFLFISDIEYNLVGATLGVLSELTDKYKTRIIGPNRLPFAEYCGHTTLAGICNAIKSTKIGVDFYGKHLYDYAINRVCCISSLKNDIVPVIDPSLDLKELVESKKLRDKYVRQAYNVVREKHTYFHRTNELFAMLGHEEIGKLCMAKLDEVVHD